MPALSVKSTVYVSLVQVAITVFGVLAAATSQKVASVVGHEEVFTSDMLMDLSLVFLLLPLLWITVVSAVRIRADISDQMKRSLFVSGFVLLGLLFLWAACATVVPWTAPMAPQPVQGEAV